LIQIKSDAKSRPHPIGFALNERRGFDMNQRVRTAPGRTGIPSFPAANLEDAREAAGRAGSQFDRRRRAPVRLRKQVWRRGDVAYPEAC